MTAKMGDGKNSSAHQDPSRTRVNASAISRRTKEERALVMDWFGGEPATCTGQRTPVTVTLTIGGDSGTTSVTADIDH
jgi:hypothetical protein